MKTISAIIIALIASVALSGPSAKAQGSKPQIMAILSDLNQKRDLVGLAVSVRNSDTVQAIRVVYCPDGLSIWKVACRGRVKIYQPRFTCNAFCLWSTKFKVDRLVQRAQGYVVIRNKAGTVRRGWLAR